MCVDPALVSKRSSVSIVAASRVAQNGGEWCAGCGHIVPKWSKTAQPRSISPHVRLARGGSGNVRATSGGTRPNFG